MVTRSHERELTSIIVSPCIGCLIHPFSSKHACNTYKPTRQPSHASGVTLLPFATVCSNVLKCHTKNDSSTQRCILVWSAWVCLGLTLLNRAGLWKQSTECSAGFVCDLAEQSWALEAELWMQCWVCVWFRCTELSFGSSWNYKCSARFVCFSWTDLGFGNRVMNVVLGLCVTQLNTTGGFEGS